MCTQKNKNKKNKNNTVEIQPTLKFSKWCLAKMSYTGTHLFTFFKFIWPKRGSLPNRCFIAISVRSISHLSGSGLRPNTVGFCRFGAGYNKVVTRPSEWIE